VIDADARQPPDAALLVDPALSQHDDDETGKTACWVLGR
jgi:hypothetical protein